MATAGGLIKEAYRVPVVAKELFKFYFGKDANRGMEIPGQR